MALGDGTDAALARHQAATIRGGSRLCAAAAALLPLGVIDEAYGVSARIVSGELLAVDPAAWALCGWFVAIAALLAWRLRVDADARRWAPLVVAVLLVLAALRVGGSPATVIAVALAISGVIYLRGDASQP